MIRDLTKQSKTNVDFFLKFEINLHLMINVSLSLQWGNAKNKKGRWTWSSFRGSSTLHHCRHRKSPGKLNNGNESCRVNNFSEGGRGWSVRSRGGAGPELSQERARTCTSCVLVRTQTQKSLGSWGKKKSRCFIVCWEGEERVKKK